MLSGTSGKVKFFDQTDNLRCFISNIRKNEPFTQQEEYDAFKRLHEGDKDAYNEIMVRNQRYLYSLAKEYARDESEVMDYVNEGNIALGEHMYEFDYKRGLKFITFAVWYIRRAMNAYLHNQRSMIRKSNDAKLYKKLTDIKNHFFAENGYYPSYEEIKEILLEKYNIPIKDISDLHDLEISSINTEIDGDYTLEESDSFVEKTSCENECLEEENREFAKELVTPLLNSLPEDSRELIKKLYNIGYTGYTTEQVKMEYNLDDSGLKTLERNILGYMRQYIEEKQSIRNVI